MNSLINLHDKYHTNNKIEDNNNFTNNLMDLDTNNVININSENNNFFFENDTKTKFEKNFFNINKENNNLNYCNNNNYFSDNKDNNIIIDSNKKCNNESLFPNIKKPCKRNYIDMLSQNIYSNNNNNNNNTIITLNINNNNYYYINNSNYNISSEEKYGIDFSKKKIFKKF